MQHHRYKNIFCIMRSKVYDGKIWPHLKIKLKFKNHGNKNTNRNLRIWQRNFEQLSSTPFTKISHPYEMVEDFRIFYFFSVDGSTDTSICNWVETYKLEVQIQGLHCFSNKWNLEGTKEQKNNYPSWMLRWSLTFLIQNRKCNK